MTGWRAFLGRWASLVVVLTVLVPVTIRPPYRNGPPIRSDGVGYHLWTRALLDGDLSFQRDHQELQTVGAISHADPDRGVYQNKYPPGLALLRLPVMAWLVKRGTSDRVISRFEHRASLILSALALVALCVVALGCCRLLSVRPWAAHAAVLALVFGTGLFHYATYDGCFTHIYSALGAVVLLGCGLRAGTGPQGAGLGEMGSAGLAAFFLVCLRGTNLILVLGLAAGYLLWRRRTSALKPWTPYRELVPVGVGVCAALVLQLAYNGYATRTLTLSSYGAEAFAWDQPMQAAVLLSYERGLFTFYPVVAVVLVTALVGRAWRAGLAFAVLLLAYVTLYGFWCSWMLGGGFGHRGFVELMPLAMVLFAWDLDSLGPRTRWVALTAALVCTVFTVELMLGYWRATLPFQGTTSDLYWSHIYGGP